MLFSAILSRLTQALLALAIFVVLVSWIFLSSLWNVLSTVLLLVIIAVVLLFVLACIPVIYLFLRVKKLRDLKQHNGAFTVAFFHPYCNAGGGGERVLWCAIRALNRRHPNVKCVVYTGDNDATKEEILEKAHARFDIKIEPEAVHFVFLRKRHFLEASRYPYFTMLGQSLGSILLGYEAIFKFLPDVFVDSMGCAFVLPLFRIVGQAKVASYVHYPTISTDMLQRVRERAQSFNNRGSISSNPILSFCKLMYYHLFAFLYGLAGRCNDIVMVNSTWTRNHIDHIWAIPKRTMTVYPPCNTAHFQQMPLTGRPRSSTQSIVSVAQFRPEKDHQLQIRAFHAFLQRIPDTTWSNYRLKLIGSCRNDEDRKRIADLKRMCAELNIGDLVEFKINIPFDELKLDLSTALIGLHTMWNEHFGIGVVECMAAGSIVLANDSGGPKMDIVQTSPERTGFLASDAESYASAIEEIVSLRDDTLIRIKTAARASIERFSDEVFEEHFVESMQTLLPKL